MTIDNNLNCNGGSNINGNSNEFFVITGKAFHTLNKLMKHIHTYNKSFIMEFYPKNGHIILKCGFIREVIVLTKQLSKNFPYFQWNPHPKFPKDWDIFSQYVSDNELVHVTGKLLSTDNYKKDVFVGGGRMYYEPVAQPYKFYNKKMKTSFKANANTLYICPENFNTFS